MKLPDHIILKGLLLFFSASVSGQKETKTDYYENGKLKSKGEIYSYTVPYENKDISKKYPFAEIQKKIKKWVYWSHDGQLQRVEHYKLVKDRSHNSLPHGRWTYFNERGVKYREDTYENGVLTDSFRDVFRGLEYAGFVSWKNGITDTAVFLPISKDRNLVMNPDFDLFYYKPVLITYHGDTGIEDWIPFWTTPGQYTPDYLSNLRYIDVFSYNYIFEMPLPDTFNYVGIALYKESDSYSEYIQGKLITPLIKGSKYCLRTSVNSCSYSRYSVGRLAFYLSSSAVLVNSTNESSFSPQVVFSDLPSENLNFTTLCNCFTAVGGEQFITAGRFTLPEDMNPVLRKDYIQGLFGLERASYYILDKIELFEVQDTSECNCNERPKTNPVQIKPEMQYETDLNKLKQGVPVILENVNFLFDSYNLLDTSDEILKTLLSFLENNPEIKISIEGHTDDIGSEQYNDELSVNRARSVYAWLINKGIDPGRLTCAGYGNRRPLFAGEDERHRALNRRVEVKKIEN